MRRSAARTPCWPREPSGSCQEGSDAVVTETYRDTYENGVIVSTDLVGTTDEAPVTEIVEYGTMVTSVSRDDRISSVHYNDDGQGGYLTFVSGDTMAFSYKTICNATAYSTKGYTASGYRTEMATSPWIRAFSPTDALFHPDDERLVGLWHGRRARLRHEHQGQQDRPLVR